MLDPARRATVHEKPCGDTERDAWLVEVAGRQWGNVTTAQLRGMGFSRSEILGMTRRSELLPMHRGVHAVGHRSPAPEARWAAALLAAGPAAALSHTAVLAVHRLIEPRWRTEVTAPTNRRGGERLYVHRAPLDGETATVRGLRATTLARTFLDLAAARFPIDRLLHEAAASGRASLADLRAFADAADGRRGVRALRRALALPHTRSRREERLVAAIEQAGLPLPVMNAPVAGMTVDGFYEELGLVLELDHDQTHGSAFARREDARRDGELSGRGLEVVRSTEIAALVEAVAARTR